MKILVTGGAGFIGSHLSEKLLELGHEVRVLDNLYSGTESNLSGFADDPSFEFQEGDVRNSDDVEEAVSGVDAVFHEAAVTSVPVSVEKPEFTREVNLGGTKNLLEKCESEGLEKFIFASTCAVYGDPEKVPVGENLGLSPESPYAESKREAELEILERSEFSPIIFRYFNVYGSRQGSGRYAGVIVKFIERLRNGEPPVIYGDGGQTRDFVFVDDVVKANVLALESEGVGEEIFNVGTGSSVSINELADVLMDIFEVDFDPVYEDSREGDIRESEADISKICDELGFSPEFSLEDGLRELL